MVLVPFPYEGGISGAPGTSGGPQAILDASAQVELYDAYLDTEPYRAGVCTVAAPDVPTDAADAVDTLSGIVRRLIKADKRVVVMGGDHSISTAYGRALKEIYGTFSVVQLDAHADLRPEYEGSPFSHASVMARLRELTPHTLQLGIRSMCAEEAGLIERESLNVLSVRDLRARSRDLPALLRALPAPVFLTLDVDVLDWSVVRATGTPEPGGLLWDEAVDLLDLIFAECRVAGFDVVELSAAPHDIASPFAAAKLIYRMIGMWLRRPLDSA